MTEALDESALLGGRVRLLQPTTGFRAAIDPVMLAAAVPAAPGDTVLDVGAGVGAAALCLAARVTDCRIAGIEIQRDLVRIAAENVALNQLAGRVDIMTGDLTQTPPRLAAGTFDHVMANPPHLEADRAHPSPHPGRAAASVESIGDLAQWVAFCLKMTRPRGSITIVHRADRLDGLFAALYGSAGAISVFPLWPNADLSRPAKRVIVQARKGVATPMRLLPGLVLHDNGRYTDSAEAVLRDAAGLEL